MFTHRLALIALIGFFTIIASNSPASLTSQDKDAFGKSPSCSNAHAFGSEHVFFGFGPYRTTFQDPRARVPSVIRAIPSRGNGLAYSLETEDSVADLHVEGNVLWVLTYNGLEEWNLETKSRVGSYRTWNTDRILRNREHPNGLARGPQDLLVISHGRLGLALFDMKKRALVHVEPLLPEQRPVESQVRDVATSGILAYLAVDNFSLVAAGAGTQPFRGLLVYDTLARRFVAQAPGLDPGVETVAVDGDSILFGYVTGPIWKHSISQVLKTLSTEPGQMAWKYPVDGYPTGKLQVSGDDILSCFVELPSRRGERARRRPVILNRKELMLE